ncbi:hypothetical protein JZ751_024668 [Albula glossodonta]|uniref:Uncharacterized protein n=1 Tax=Albula glossodonta TaxID=121402 RepID=A0A8T2PF00_9TELE|nr:hypothetical protein JZ751_024668 [Albula glossodonta]
MEKYRNSHPHFPPGRVEGPMAGASVTVGTGVAFSLAREVCSSALLASAALSCPLISSILSCSSSSSPSWGGAHEEGVELGVGAEEGGSGRTMRGGGAAGPPFSQIRPTRLSLAPALSPSGTARARRRRLLSVSRLKWTRLLSLGSREALLLSLFHLEVAPGGGAGGGGCGGCTFWMLQLREGETQ